MNTAEEPLSSPAPQKTSDLLTRSVFLRLLGVVYLVAFASFTCQADGLIGSRGILPAERYLQALHQRFGADAYWRWPTLAWLNAGDDALHLLCALGVLLSVLVVLGVFPKLCLVVLWVLYLSAHTIGQDFLSFQWDTLLLETGFLAILYAPVAPFLAARYGSALTPPPRVARLLLIWLLFRLMFFSGVVKLTSDDPTWANWTAMSYHYETQPLPTWTSWYAHQLPMWADRATTGATFFVELVIPFLYFAPRRARVLAAVLTVLLQLSIAATGNYGFFNLLAVVLCVPLLDDRCWPARMRARREPPQPAPAPRWREWMLLPVAAVIVATSTLLALMRAGYRHGLDDRVARAVEFVTDFRITSAYGLFAVMTTQRPEIVIQGSDDGIEWKSYGFRYKPDDDLARRPRFCTPHMPRLDWQLWFAAMGQMNHSPWTIPLMQRILEGSPAVLGLMGHNPFPDAPPKFVRVLVYDYRFTTFAERAQSGHWWKREPQRMFCPPVTLEDFARWTSD